MAPLHAALASARFIKLSLRVPAIPARYVLGMASENVHGTLLVYGSCTLARVANKKTQEGRWVGVSKARIKQR
jgi:hypothetical protein